MMRNNRLAGFFLAIGGLLIMAGAALILTPTSVFAQDASPTPAAPSPASSSDTTPTGDDSYCLVCHAQPDQTYTLADGSTFDITAHPDAIAASVHGTSNQEGAFGCVDCHGEKIYPHTDPLPVSSRAYAVQQSATICARCHAEQTQQLVDSVHYNALAAGNLTAATCVDCHGSHDVQSLSEKPQDIALTCGNCHVSVFDQFKESVHGVALFDGDTNVPTCTNCHGVHGIQNATTALFRNRSPELCATCHGDADLMAKYDISTHVFDTYLTDFHGKTVALFEQQDPNVATNKAVCIDCHGVHDIANADAEGSRTIRENLLQTCQQCHPGATSDFPAAWVGHFPPTAESHPLLFVVNLFYTILIPVTIGGFLLLVATDVYRRIRGRRGG